MSRVGIEEAATIGADHLDRFLRRHRTHGQGLHLGIHVFQHRLAAGIVDRLTVSADFGLLIIQRLHDGGFFIRIEILDHALTDQEHGENHRQRQ